jgi:soluble lytic murein transglycosylase-like protein
MQIDDRYHKAYIQAHRNDDHRANILYGAKVLADALKALRGDLRHAISAYNCGVSRVQQALREGKDSDAYTTGRDYASDVLGRADLVRLRVSPAIRAPISLVPIALALGLALTHYQK